MNANNNGGKVRFTIDKSGFFAESAMILLVLSAIFRIIGCWGLWTDEFFAVTQIALPIASGLLFIVMLLLLGRHALWATSLPVLLGVAFFILKSFGFESALHTLLCILLYILVAVLYVGTVFGLIRTKWLLVPLFGLPFLYHILVEDLAALRDTAHPVTLTAGLQEISVLCIMLSLLFVSLAMKKKKPLTDAQKEKIRLSLPVMTPEEEKAENAQIKALFKEYHVSVFTKIKRKFKKWREDKKLKNERVNETDDKK